MDNNLSATIQAETFLGQLRAKTSQSHTDLEGLDVSKSILSPNVTKEAYAYYLNLMHDVVNDVETNIFPIVGDAIPDLEERRKTTQLASDLAVLNFIKQTSIPVFTKDIKSFDIPFALGILYVVEGSSLGGRFILKNIQSALGYDESRGAQYFAGYGNQTGSHWKHFLNALTSYEATHSCGETIIAGADFAFRAIHKHFSDSQSA